MSLNKIVTSIIFMSFCSFNVKTADIGPDLTEFAGSWYVLGIVGYKSNLPQPKCWCITLSYQVAGELSGTSTFVNNATSSHMDIPFSAVKQLQDEGNYDDIFEVHVPEHISEQALRVQIVAESNQKFSWTLLNNERNNQTQHFFDKLIVSEKRRLLNKSPLWGDCSSI